MGQLKLYLELIADFATIVGFPLAFAVFWWQKNEERKQSHLNTYSSVDEKFFEYLKICSENPKLHCSLYSDDSIELSEEQNIQRIAIYEMLICVFERVHIYYTYKYKNPRMVNQEKGWEVYIKKWLNKDSFRKVWNEVKDSYDSDFVEYLEKINRQITITDN